MEERRLKSHQVQRKGVWALAKVTQFPECQVITCAKEQTDKLLPKVLSNSNILEF